MSEQRIVIEESYSDSTSGSTEDGVEMSKLDPAGDWREHLRHIVMQERLIETGPTLEALTRLRMERAPRAVYLGVGLCTASEVSVCLPADLLGILLAAERVRQAVRAEALVVLVADEHAKGNGFHPERVEQRADETEALLHRLGQRLQLSQLEILRASRVHRTSRYRRVLAEVELRAPPEDGAYFRRQVADVEYMHRERGGVIKVGWVVSASPRVERRRDELAFDERFREWSGEHVGFVYCKAGRTLDDHRPKASPYVVVDPSRRICLLPDEDVAGKLERARRHSSPATVRGARRHLKSVARLFSEVVGALDGPVEQRLQAMIAAVFARPADQSKAWHSSYASISGR